MSIAIGWWRSEKKTSAEVESFSTSSERKKKRTFPFFALSVSLAQKKKKKTLSATSAQPLAALFGPPRPEPRAGGGPGGRFGPVPEPLASNIVVVAETCKTPWELISEHPLLSGVAKAIRGGNDTALWALLNDPDAPVTVLAPDNEALTSAAKALGIPLSAALNGSEPMVSAILRNHVLNTTKPLSALGPESTVTSFAGAPVRVFSPTLVAEKKANKSRKAGAAAAPSPAATDDGASLAPAPAPKAPAAAKKEAEKAAAADPAEPVPRRRSRRALSEATTYVNKDATSGNGLNTPDPSVGGSAIISTVVDLANNALGGNSSGAAASSGGNSTGSGVSPVDALLNSFISLFAGIMGGGGGGNGMMGMMGGGGGNSSSTSLFMGNPSKDLGPGWKVSKRRGCAGGCSRVSDWTFAPVGKTAASSLPDNATYAVLRNATVEAGNVRTCGGFLQVVDGVLVPELLSRKEKGKGDSRVVVLELGDGDGAAVSRITVPLNRSMEEGDDGTRMARANVTVEYLGKVAKGVAAREKEAAAAAAAKKKAAAAAASPAPAPAADAADAAAAPAPAAPATKKKAAEDVVVAPAPAPEVTQASVAAASKSKAPEPAKVVGETIAPKGAKQSPSA